MKLFLKEINYENIFKYYLKIHKILFKYLFRYEIIIKNIYAYL